MRKNTAPAGPRRLFCPDSVRNCVAYLVRANASDRICDAYPEFACSGRTSFEPGEGKMQHDLTKKIRQFALLLLIFLTPTLHPNRTASPRGGSYSIRWRVLNNGLGVSPLCQSELALTNSGQNTLSKPDGLFISTSTRKSVLFHKPPRCA